MNNRSSGGKHFAGAVKEAGRAVIAAFSTFSVIPTPRIEWSPAALKGMLGALPLVGCAIGLAGYLWYLIAGALALPQILTAAVLTILPPALSGAIHMDGFCDTVDALCSFGDMEKKRAILKDPHIGAFAAIGTGCYLLLYFALCASLPLRTDMIVLFGLTHVLSRVAGGLASALLPVTNREGMLRTFREDASSGNVIALAVFGVISLAAAAVLSPLAAALFLLAGTGVFFYVKRTARKHFGGMSGDLAGFGITLAEIAFLAVLVLAERMAALWF